jgi:peptidoglycan/xylan/chitin deacetylase (PgdA/CDA1 family)
MKKILLTFDYELYFGTNSGTQENCIIKPTEKIRKLLAKHEVKATFFVDAGYLLKLEQHKESCSSLQRDYKSLVNQIQLLGLEGHEIQLHIHPHWEDSFYDGKQWVMDTSRYRLHDFSKEEVEDIVKRYKEVLTKLIDNKIFVFRAGGWSIQPFVHIKNALKKHHIYFDSTIYKGGEYKSQTHYFNFRNAPKSTKWHFEDDPLIEKHQGFFTEIPISSYRLSPWFFWKFVCFKKFGGAKHKVFGDGMAAKGSKLDQFKMLTQMTHSVVSMDGYKSSFLLKAYHKFLKDENQENFVVIGHPKSMTLYALEKIEKFIIERQKSQFTTYKELENAISNNQ